MKLLIFILLICFASTFLISGCTFCREMNVTAGADGAKTKIYGNLEEGEVMYSSKTFFRFGCCKINKKD